MVCHTHGWTNLSPYSWDYNTGSIKFAVLINDKSIDISAVQNKISLEVSIISHEKLTKSTLMTISNLVKRSLSLNTDITDLYKIASKFGEEYKSLIENGAGRLLRAPTLWEDAAKTLFTTNCSWKLTQKMCEKICSELFVSPTPSGKFPFPTAKIINKYSSKDLKKMIPVGYRNEYLKSLAERFAKNPGFQKLESKKMDYTEANKTTKQLKGFGPYACAHILLLAGYYNEIPVDTVIISYLKRTHRVRKPESFIERHYRKWGKYKWWGLKLEKMMYKQNWLGD